MRDRSLAAFNHRRLDKYRTRPVIAERLIHRNGRWQFARHHREINFAGFAIHHRRLQHARHLGVFSEHHNATGLTVQSKDQMHRR